MSFQKELTGPYIIHHLKNVKNFSEKINSTPRLLLCCYLKKNYPINESMVNKSTNSRVGFSGLESSATL